MKSIKLGKGIILVVVTMLILSVLFTGCSSDKVVITSYVPGDYFVTNIKDSARLLKTNVVLELTTDKAEEFLVANNHIIRDVIIFTLREHTEEELRSSGIEDILGVEIVTNLESALEIEYIQRVYFDDFVVQ